MLRRSKSIANKEKLKLSFSQILLALLSGLLLALSFTVTWFSWLTWFALIPFFLSLYNYKINATNGFKLSFMFSLTYYLLLLTWLFRLHPLTWIGFSEIQSILLISAGWFIFSFIESLGLSFVGGIIGLLKPKSLYSKILLPISLWIVIEWMQSLGATGFTWGRLAISQFENLPLIQSSNLFGSTFVSALIVLTNVVITLSILDYQKRKLSYKPIISTIIILIINAFYGYYSINYKVDDGREINAAVIQGNILSDQKWDMKAIDMLNLYKGLTEDAIKQHPKTNIVVWPESAITDAIDLKTMKTRRYEEILPGLMDIAKKNNIYLTTGIFTIKYSEDGKPLISNSIVTISPDEKLLGPYLKRHLVPFGEYLPFRNIIEVLVPSVAKMNAVGTDVFQGTDSVIMNTPLAKLGGIVCYDSIVPQLIMSSVNDGAELLVLVTNDSWYKDSMGVYQHNAQSVFRSVESDRYMLRAANTGISTIIKPDGEIISKLDPLVKGFIYNTVRSRNTKTLYATIGDSIVLLAFLIIVFLVIIRKNNDLMLMKNE